MRFKKIGAALLACAMCFGVFSTTAFAYVDESVATEAVSYTHLCPAGTVLLKTPYRFFVRRRPPSSRVLNLIGEDVYKRQPLLGTESYTRHRRKQRAAQEAAYQGSLAG